MPEVKASPATPDKSLSHSRYSLAIAIFGLKSRFCGEIRQGPSIAAVGHARTYRSRRTVNEEEF
jgi:hypothetical protein